MEIERRYFDIAELRVRADDRGPVIEGYAAVFNKLSEDLGGFREKIKPGAFRSAIKRTDTVMLFNHDPNYPLGRVSAGTLTIKEDKKGLLVSAKPPKSAERVIEAIERGDVTKMSFGFTTEKDEWQHKKNESIRTLVEVGQLPDVGPVVFPAYPDTTVAVRSLERSKATAPVRTDDPQRQAQVVRTDDPPDDKTYWRILKEE